VPLAALLPKTRDTRQIKLLGFLAAIGLLLLAGLAAELKKERSKS